MQCPPLTEIPQSKSFLQSGGTTTCVDSNTKPYLTSCKLECNTGYKISADKDTSGVVTCGVDDSDPTLGKWTVNGGAALSTLSCAGKFKNST